MKNFENFLRGMIHYFKINFMLNSNMTLFQCDQIPLNRASIPYDLSTAKIVDNYLAAHKGSKTGLV